jgi:hypothetical protein
MPSFQVLGRAYGPYSERGSIYLTLLSKRSEFLTRIILEDQGIKVKSLGSESMEGALIAALKETS